MRILREIVLLLVIYFVMHAVISIFNPHDVGFFRMLLNTLFLFLYLGFFPVIISFTVSALLRKHVVKIKESPIINDAAFIAVLLMSTVVTFFGYHHLGMLAA